MIRGDDQPPSPGNTFADWLQLRAGLFLNPFGIWNVDHGSPTLIALMLPIEAARPAGTRRTYADQRKTTTLKADQSGGVAWETTVAYKEYVVGADVSLESEYFRLKFESVLRWVDREEGKREATFGFGTTAYAPDQREVDTYLLSAMKTRFGLQPYVMFEYARRLFVMPDVGVGQTLTQDRFAILVPSFGANYSFTPHTMIKLQSPWALLYNTRPWGRRTTVPAIFLRLVSAF